MLLPFVWLFSMSFRPAADAYKMPPSFFPPSLDFTNYRAGARLARAVPADLLELGDDRRRRDGRPARHLHARRLRLRAAQLPGPRQPVLRPADRADVPGAGDHPADLSRLRQGRPPQQADRPRADVSDLELRRVPRPPVHAEPAQGARGSRADGRRGLLQDLLAHLAAAAPPGALRPRHHHLHPDLELLFPGQGAARQGDLDDAAGRDGRAARLPRLRATSRW